jgi:hypothetical protein
MSYYILPKKHTNTQLEPILSNSLPSSIISTSLQIYLQDINNQLEIFKNSYEDTNFDSIKQLMNPYEFVFSNIIGTNISVSKGNPQHNVFYTFIEIVHMFSILDYFYGKNIKSIHFGPNYSSTIECMDILRDSCDIQYGFYIGKKFEKLSIEYGSVDFLYLELNDNDYQDIKQYTKGLLIIMCYILSYQSPFGISIVKFDNIFHKPILDILFLLSGAFEKIYIIKPNITNSYHNDRYIICKHFIMNPTRKLEYMKYMWTFQQLIKEDKYISSIIKHDLPYYFINKIEESNIIIGHQQIELINQLICILKNKNKEEKIEMLKKNNIQKCIQWCEKYKLPYNKLYDKINIFL